MYKTAITYIGTQQQQQQQLISTQTHKQHFKSLHIYYKLICNFCLHLSLTHMYTNGCGVRQSDYAPLIWPFER